MKATLQALLPTLVPRDLFGAIDQSLAAIAQSARESLTEVRMLIETLISEPEGHSHPTLDAIPTLIERMESAGVEVAYSTFGEPESLTAGVRLRNGTWATASRCRSAAVLLSKVLPAAKKALSG